MSDIGPDGQDMNGDLESDDMPEATEASRMDGGLVPGDPTDIDGPRQTPADDENMPMGIGPDDMDGWADAPGEAPAGPALPSNP
jgi:hypothetical protein